MNTKIFILILSIFLQAQSINADSCQGKGTVFFFGNGMFNTKKDAQDSLDALRSEVRKSVNYDRSKNIKFNLAYKTSEPTLTQISYVVSQKKIDSYENFWLWLNSNKKAPEWFHESLKFLAAKELRNGMTFEDLRDHFESYSDYIRWGYNIILISHSQGNFYANQVMRKLSDYTDASLTSSLEDKRKENPLFPEFSDLFANVQVATPVSATVNLSPWSTFQDDLIMAFVRKTLGALPANLKTPGSNIPPDGDLLGHHFIKAYLRNNESRSKILSDIQAQYSKLRYPIAYFQKAVLLESRWRHYGKGDHIYSPDADLYFDISGPSGKSVEGKDEERPSKNEIIHQTFAYCYELPVGTSKIFLSVDSEEKREVSFEAWPEGKKEGANPRVISFSVKRGNSDWEVGLIQTEKGVGKEPLQVKVEIYSQPKPRKIEEKDL